MGLQGPAKDPHKEMSGSTGRDSNRGSLLRESGTLTTILRLTPLLGTSYLRAVGTLKNFTFRKLSCLKNKPVRLEEVE